MQVTQYLAGKQARAYNGASGFWLGLHFNFNRVSFQLLGTCQYAVILTGLEQSFCSFVTLKWMASNCN